MNSSLVLILDPRGVVLGGKNDVIERHSNYGRELAKQNKAIVSKLKVFSASTGQISASSNNNSFEILRKNES